MFSVATTSSMD
ncbi:hypothetical protein HU200_048995 [Digitaria exilis]|uniref:Uncharacterized protein n=1 Tax=Digitaria exilis TaxID=1010633 RepID=A0A835ARY7_9POAL|nr:hypothetical protein HU200_048995 [Digitaria exilis]